MLAFCNNTGPGFIVATVGVSFFQSITVGIALYCIHILSAVLTGIVFSFFAKYTPRQSESQTRHRFSAQLVTAIKTSSFSALFITGMIVFFSVIIQSLSFLPEESQAVFGGALEISNGIAKTVDVFHLSPLALILTSVFLAFGGLSVHCQAAMLAEESNLSLKQHFLGKTVQAAFAGILTFLFLVF